MSGTSQLGNGDDRSSRGARLFPIWWKHWGSTIIGIAVIGVLVSMAIIVHDLIWWILAGIVTIWLAYHLSWLTKSLDD